MKEGYTLIELIAVTGIMVVFSTIIASMIIFSIRGATTAKIANIVAQNGNYAQSAITTILLSTEKIEEIDGVDFDDVNNCVTTLTDIKEIKITQLDEAQTTLTCNSTSPESEYIQVDTNYVSPLMTDIVDKSLIDRSEVRVKNCRFSCSQRVENTPPLIEASFTIEDRNGIFAEQKYTSTFNTSVTLRNY